MLQVLPVVRVVVEAVSWVWATDGNAIGVHIMGAGNVRVVGVMKVWFVGASMMLCES